MVQQSQILGLCMAVVGGAFGFLFLITLVNICRMRKDFQQDYGAFQKKRKKDSARRMSMGPR